MRRTKKLIAYTALQAVFTAVVPLAFLFTQYGATTTGVQYKLPLGVILVAVVTLWIAKNTLLRPRIAKLTASIAQHESDLKVEADQAKIRNLENALKTERVTETVLNAVMPLLVLSGLLVLCKALESAVLVLSGAVGFTLASFAVGTVCGVLAAREVTGKHHVKESKSNGES